MSSGVNSCQVFSIPSVLHYILTIKMMCPNMIRYHPYVHQAAFGLPGIVGLFLTIAFWILVILLVAKLISHFSKNNDGPVDDEMEDNKFLEIIKERYARGEINKKGFEELKKNLEI